MLFGSNYPFTAETSSYTDTASLNNALEDMASLQLKIKLMEQMFHRSCLALLGI